ncbi:MAG: NtaA/DmoA family FMN-dependent monooxygenase [Actinobacteria bacterium]|nr:NtaA/DmoA family FMN-dependent monooxygenase [Actinomycetota bacterium]
MNNASHFAHGLWRRPDAARQRDFEGLASWLELVRTLERGRFDMLFLADVIGAYDVYRGGWETTVREGTQFPTNDPLVLLAALVGGSEHLGLALTSSVFYQHPFPFARQISTLDHLSGGRVAWNVVTSVIENGVRNLGLEGLPAHDDRYRWADEYVEVVYKLWERSWEDEALRKDTASGVFSDPGRVHEIGHRGERYRVGGPHLSSPSPQRTPVMLQAGSSDAGREFAANHAELVLVVASTPKTAGALAEDIRRRAAAAGRRAEEIRFIVAMTFVVAPTEREARELDADLAASLSDDGIYAQISGHLQLDLATIDLDRPLDEFETEGMQGILRDMRERVPPERRAETSYRDVIDGFARRRFVGSPDQVADEIERWTAAGMDGVNVLEMIRPNSYEDFVELVVPVLQDRGLSQREYQPGTLREKLFGAGPRLPSSHPAVAGG